MGKGSGTGRKGRESQRKLKENLTRFKPIRNKKSGSTERRRRRFNFMAGYGRGRRFTAKEKASYWNGVAKGKAQARRSASKRTRGRR